MNTVAIAYLTKDRTELTERTIGPLLQHDKFDLHWFDGSATPEGQKFFENNAAGRTYAYPDVRGGPDAAVAFALTRLLAHQNNYQYVGIVENDVSLKGDWFDATMDLLQQAYIGLTVGAASPRCYEDRILIQRDGHAIVHNLGWGVVIFTRHAARLALANMRTGNTIENRRIFAQLCGIDIGTYWAFRASEHALCADWGNDKMLAAHGLASLALTPSPVEMIGQTPPLAEQGLTIAAAPVEARRDDKAFELYRKRTARIFDGWNILGRRGMPEPNGATVIFAHQIGALGGAYSGDWNLRWAQGFGPFAWKAGNSAEWREAHFATDETWQKSTVLAPISGPCQILVSGGDTGGQFLVEDLQSGYSIDPMLASETEQGIIGLTVPAGVAYRAIRVTALTPGVVFYGVKVFEPQPNDPTWAFDHSVLPPV